MACQFDGCDKHPRGANALCDGHLRQKQRGKPLSSLRPYRMPAGERLKRAATRYVNAGAEDDEEFERARVLLEKYGQGSGGRLRIQRIVESVVEVVLRRLG